MGQKSENIFESRMGLIVIPADYEKRSDRVVPICIRAEDDLGNRIAEGWIHGVVRVADRIRTLARNFLADEWRSSELADETVQELWSIHKGDVGLKPHSRVYAHAKWKALDKRVGGRRVRKGLDVELLEHVLLTLNSEPEFDQQIETRDLFEQIEQRLIDMGMSDVREMLNLALHRGELNFRQEGHELRNTISKRFWRGIRKAANLL